MNRIRTALVALALAAGLIAAGCSTPRPTAVALVDYPTPTTYTVTYQGACYAGYMYDIHEVDMLGAPATCVRMLYPSYPPAAGTLHAALWSYLLEYDSFFHSGLYYDSYLSPMQTKYHVTIVNKTSFLNTSSSFDKTYAAQIKTSSARAKYSNGKTGAYSFPTSNAKAKTKPLTNVTPTKAAGGAKRPTGRPTIKVPQPRTPPRSVVRRSVRKSGRR